MSKEIPKATHMGLTFYPVPQFDGPAIAFGADEKCYFPRRNLPKVPREFEDHANRLMFSGGKLPDLDTRVDIGRARSAVHALLSSWSPSHEAKVATVGYAFWVWSSKEAIDAATKVKA